MIRGQFSAHIEHRYREGYEGVSEYQSVNVVLSIGPQALNAAITEMIEKAIEKNPRNPEGRIEIRWNARRE